MGVRTVYIELRATAEKLRADMAAAGKEVIALGKDGEESGKRMARGVNEASVSLRKVAEEAAEATLATAGAYHAFTTSLLKYGAAATTAGGNTEGLVNTYRALRIALSPTPFTIAAVATGVLAEQTIKLANARARLIEQQSLMAATTGRSVGGIEAIHSASVISGANDGKLQGLIDAFGKNAKDSPGDYRSGLAALGQTQAEFDATQWVDGLAKIARAFDSIDDPAKRATLAVQLFGKENAAEALQELTPAFAAAADAASKFGLSLNSTSRQQIYAMRRDLKDLGSDLTHYPQIDAWAEWTKTRLAEVAAAYYDMAKRGGHALADLADKYTGFRAIGKDVPDEDLGAYARSHQGVGRNQKQGDIDARVLSDDLFADSQAAALRQSMTLEGKKKSLEDAKEQQEASTDALSVDQQKRAVNGNDPTLMSGEQRLQMVVRRQSAQTMISSLQGQITAMEKTEEAAKKLADFQAEAANRLNALYQSATASEIKDPLARQIFESNVEVGRDSDKTTPDEKQGRGLIELGKIQSVAKGEQFKAIQDYLADVAKTEAADRETFEKLLKQYSSDFTKASDGQRKIDTGQMDSARSLSEHGIKLAGAQSQPGNEAQLAKDVLSTRLQTVAAERAILDAHQAMYSVADRQVELNRLDKESTAAQLEYEQQIAEILKQRVQFAIQAGGAYQQRLKQLAQEVDALNSIKVTSENIRDIEASRKALADQVLQSTVEQKLTIGDLASGWDAFWISMQEQAEKPGKILYDGMHAAVDGIAEDVSRVATGQKGGFGKTFQSVGEGIVKQSTSALMQKGLGSLGKLMGISGPGKPDGTQMNPFYVVQAGGAPAQGQTGTTPTLGGVANAAGTAGLSGALSGIGGWFSKLFGRGGDPSVTSSISFMAGGGDADPGKIYGVAEAGEAELISPKNSSRITPVSKLGGTHYHDYHIDARGADLGAENRVMRAIEFAHNSAVSNSVRANSERAKRTPKRSS